MIFLALVERHNISWHEKGGGANCSADDTAKDLIAMLIRELEGRERMPSTGNRKSRRSKSGDNLFHVATNRGSETARTLVVATGGKSIPKMGANRARLRPCKTIWLKAAGKPGLRWCPLTFSDNQKSFAASLAGLSVDAEVKFGKMCFREGLLFTHRGPVRSIHPPDFPPTGKRASR